MKKSDLLSSVIRYVMSVPGESTDRSRYLKIKDTLINLLNVAIDTQAAFSQLDDRSSAVSSARRLIRDRIHPSEGEKATPPVKDPVPSLPSPSLTLVLKDSDLVRPEQSNIVDSPPGSDDDAVDRLITRVPTGSTDEVQFVPQKFARGQYPTKEYLNQVFDADPQTGDLFWKVTLSTKTRKGMLAGSLTPSGRRMVGLGGIVFKASDLIWIMHKGPIPEGHAVRHKEGPSDALSNLELIALKNRLSPDSGMQEEKSTDLIDAAWGPSPYRGVQQRILFRKEDGSLYRASYRVRFRKRPKGKKVVMGVFATAREAALFYDREARKLYGSKAILNFPNEIPESNESQEPTKAATA